MDQFHQSRRNFLKLLSLGVIGHELDIDRLLWVPHSKTIFLPSPTKLLTYDQIVAIEVKNITYSLKELFEKDDIFYSKIKSKFM